MSKKLLAKTQYIALYEHERGRASLTMDDGAIIVPINRDRLVLVHTEPSLAYDGLRSLHVPGGAVETGEDPSITANREMQEEIGYKANQIDYLGVVDILTKYIACRVFLYLGRDLEKSQLQGDEPDDWLQSHRPIALSEIESLMTNGILRDSTTINALLLARQFLEN